VHFANNLILEQNAHIFTFMAEKHINQCQKLVTKLVTNRKGLLKIMLYKS